MEKGLNLSKGGSSGDGRDISEEVERRRVFFEQTWGQPTAPSIEQLLGEVPKTEQSVLLRELLYIEFEFIQRKAAELKLEQYLTRFPEHESLIRDVAQDVGSYTVFKRRSIAGYTLLGELGRGGMGVVYRAKSDFLNNYVAFKMVNQRMVGDQQALQRFTRELEMIGRLRHPNIVEAKHAGIAPDGSPFLVMELLEGITLSQWSKENPPSEKRLNEKPMESKRIADACEIIHDVALGLQAIHEAGLVHRDIKPGNIMLLPDGRVKILDLGLAKLREHLAEAENPLEFEHQTQQGHLLGTFGYMAPEQMHSAAHVDIRADIYSLGCTFFFLLYGRTPAENQPKELLISLPQKLRKILDRMLAADPGSRFQEPKEIAGALETFLVSRKPLIGKTVITATVTATVAAVALVFIGLVSIFFTSTFSDGQELNLPETKPPTNESIADPKNTLADVRAAVDLRYRGDVEWASEQLRKLESDLRSVPFDGSNELLAEVLSAQGDCIFFSGFASGTVPEKTVKRLSTWYEEALKRTENPVLRTKLLCKTAVVNDETKEISGADENSSSLYLLFAEALTSTNDLPLRHFVEQFELSTDPELMTREAMDLRLFSLERLIHRDMATDQTQSSKELLTKDLRSLDAVLLAPYPDTGSCVYLNRFFDLAIRVCDSTDYGQLAKYLCRSRPQGAAGTRSSIPPGSTLLLIYFSPWSDANGFAVYYPAERDEAKRFELPFNRRDVKEAIRKGESLELDAELVSLVRRDLGAGTPIILSWDDTACWPLRRDAFSNEDWPFDKSITLEEILGRMK